MANKNVLILSLGTISNTIYTLPLANVPSTLASPAL